MLFTKILWDRIYRYRYRSPLDKQDFQPSACRILHPLSDPKCNFLPTRLDNPTFKGLEATEQ
jgi:hypothetical protein